MASGLLTLLSPDRQVDESVGAGTSGEQVGAAAAGQLVVPRATVERVVATLTYQGILALAAIDAVGTGFL